MSARHRIVVVLAGGLLAGLGGTRPLQAAGEGQPAAVVPGAAVRATGAASEATLPAGVRVLRYEEGALLTVQAEGADLAALLGAVVQPVGIELVVQEGVEGRVTATFESLPLADGIRAILQAAGAENYAVEYREERNQGRGGPGRVFVLRKEKHTAASEGVPAAPEQPLTPKKKWTAKELGTGLDTSDEEQAGFYIVDLVKTKSKEAIPPLIRAMQSDRSERTRAEAAEALGPLGYVEAIPSLLPMLNDRSDEVRVKAAAALMWLGRRAEAIPVLDEMAEKGHPLALDRLVYCKSERGVQVKVLDDDVKAILVKAAGTYRDPWVRANAALFLSEEPGYADIVLDAVEDIYRTPGEDGKVSTYLIGAARRVGSPRAERFLQKVADEDPKKGVREDASSALRKMRDR